MSGNELDRQIREQLYDMEAPVPEDAFASIQQNMGQKQRAKKAAGLLTGYMLLSALGLYISLLDMGTLRHSSTAKANQEPVLMEQSSKKVGPSASAKRETEQLEISDAPGKATENTPHNKVKKDLPKENQKGRLSLSPTKKEKGKQGIVPLNTQGETKSNGNKKDESDPRQRPEREATWALNQENSSSTEGPSDKKKKYIQEPAAIVTEKEGQPARVDQANRMDLPALAMIKGGLKLGDSLQTYKGPVEAVPPEEPLYYFDLCHKAFRWGVEAAGWYTFTKLNPYADDAMGIRQFEKLNNLSTQRLGMALNLQVEQELNRQWLLHGRLGLARAQWSHSYQYFSTAPEDWEVVQGQGGYAHSYQPRNATQQMEMQTKLHMAQASLGLSRGVWEKGPQQLSIQALGGWLMASQESTQEGMTQESNWNAAFWEVGLPYSRCTRRGHQWGIRPFYQQSLGSYSSAHYEVQMRNFGLGLFWKQ